MTSQPYQHSRQLAFYILIGVALGGLIVAQWPGLGLRMGRRGPDGKDDPHDVVKRDERSVERFRQELDGLAIETPFHEEWFYKHEVNARVGWSDNGYDPRRSKYPRDLQLLDAATYARAQLSQGGFRAYFNSQMGVTAPELAEWLDRAELAEAAKVVRDASARLGDTFPRAITARRDALASVEKSQERPFVKLDKKFADTLQGRRFDEAADRWLRENCGIKSLLDEPPL